MMDLWLLIAVLAVFGIGWFLVKKLDDFLDENGKVQEESLEKGENVLRIGFSNPFVADSISSALEQYSRHYPDVSVCLFHGDVEKLLKKMALHKLDIAFLPEQVEIPSDKDYNRKNIIVSSTPVMMKYGGLPIEPIANGNISQNIVWMKQNKVSIVECFIQYMVDEVPYISCHML